MALPAAMTRRTASGAPFGSDAVPSRLSVAF